MRGIRALGAITVPMLLAGACSTTTVTGERHEIPVFPADLGCIDGRPDEAGARFAENDIYPDAELLIWPRATPEEVGLDRALLERATEAVSLAPGLHSLLIVRHGRLVWEEYFNGARPEDARNLHSATKSLLSLVIGIAIDDGYLSLDTPIDVLLPDLVPGTALSGVTVEQMLAMQSGTESYDDRPIEGDSLIAAALAAPRVVEPGTVFSYNTGISAVLALAVDRTVPGGMCRYARSRLFGPLGIDVEHWHRLPGGVVGGGNDTFMTPRELARIGQFVLDGGRAGGRQVVSTGWLDTMLEPRWVLPTNRWNGRTPSYALHWWVHDLAGIPIWNASGHGGQDVLILPTEDMVVVLTHDTFDQVEPVVPWPDLLRSFIVPATGDAVPCPCHPDLVRMRLDGSDPVVLAPDPGNDVYLEWSPDGSQIAFHTFRDLNAEVYLMSADGTGLRRLTTSWGFDFGPRWAPDGQRLAFVSNRAGTGVGDGLEVYVMDPGAGGIDQVTFGNGDVRWFAWSPDGRRMVVVRGDRSGLGDLSIVDLETGAESPLGGPRGGFPEWSPDGPRIAIEVAAGDGRAIALLEVGSGTVTSLGRGGLPQWSGDGTVVYATDGDVLVAYDTITGARTEVGPYAHGRVSPDGEWIVVGREGR